MAKLPVGFGGLPLGDPSTKRPIGTPTDPPDPDCCCPGEDGVTVACCERTLPLVLVLSLANTADCPCINGQSVVLTWDAVDGVWKGSGAAVSANCTVDTAEWRLSCGGTDCSGFTLNLNGPVGGGSCLSVTDTANGGCTCDPLVLEFTINASGIGCCNAIPGAGTIAATVTE